MSNSCWHLCPIIVCFLSFSQAFENQEIKIHKTFRKTFSLVTTPSELPRIVTVFHSCHALSRYVDFYAPPWREKGLPLVTGSEMNIFKKKSFCGIWSIFENFALKDASLFFSHLYFLTNLIPIVHVFFANKII